jgi:hypothetical protein
MCASGTELDMPVEFGLWRIDGDSQRVQSTKLREEKRLENLIVSDTRVLGEDLLILGQQVATDSGNQIDVLGMDPEGNIEVIEIKRDRTPREVIAQILDYASWVQELTYDDISTIYETNNGGQEFEEAFSATFDSRPEGMSGPPEEVNQSHSLTVVASELDSSTERIVEYLSDEYGVPINALFFNYYQDGEREYIGRSWLKDPRETKEQPSKKEVWNGHDFYVSFGEGRHRSWEDAREYGFISGGQGRWYSRTLEQLFEGARIFVRVPQEGYVGVGEVTSEVVRVTEFEVENDGEMAPILEAPLDAEAMDENVDDPEKCEYVVGVEWFDTRDIEDAVDEKGLFANQNTACKMRNQFTIRRLTEVFEIEEE